MVFFALIVHFKVRTEGRGWLVVVCVGVLLEAAGDGGRAHGRE